MTTIHCSDRYKWFQKPRLSKYLREACIFHFFAPTCMYVCTDSSVVDEYFAYEMQLSTNMSRSVYQQ